MANYLRLFLVTVERKKGHLSLKKEEKLFSFEL